MTDHDGKRGRRGLDGYFHMRNHYGERDDESGVHCHPPPHPPTVHKDDETGGTITGDTRGRYGLIGTTLSNNDKNNGTSAEHLLRGGSSR